MAGNHKQSPISRQEQILQALATMLEDAPLEKITTAKLAATVGVSEAALYRHFPSKAKMFESLIAFAEEAMYTAGVNSAGECACFPAEATMPSSYSGTEFSGDHKDCLMHCTELMNPAPVSEGGTEPVLSS